SMRLTGRASTLLCPVSEDLASSMRDFGMGNHAQVIPNVVDTNLFKRDEATASSGDSFELVHISSLSDEQKNISGMLRAIAVALPQCPQLRVTIIGDGDPLPHQQLAQTLGIANRVHIQGEIPLTEVAERMRVADALILFSNFENFPCVIPEAWASGIPVISTDVGGIAEHLTSERGILIKRGDEDALTAAIVSMATRPSLAHRDASALRAIATSTFSIESIADQYTTAYQKALHLHASKDSRTS
ncbi:MAG: glycosyltransferase, partial [Flavobacteriales bacterium]|nr:glycosyltransferase [Flavobacteriales bacterium]